MTLTSLVYVLVMSALEIACAIVGRRLVRRTWERPYKGLVLLAVVTVAQAGSILNALGGLLGFIVGFVRYARLQRKLITLSQYEP